MNEQKLRHPCPHPPLPTCRVKDPSGSGKMIDDYWTSAQKVLSDPDFVKKLKVI